MGVLARGFDRMIGTVGRGELQPFVGFGTLPRHGLRRAIGAVGVAAEAQFILPADSVDNRACGVDALDLRNRPEADGARAVPGLEA